MSKKENKLNPIALANTFGLIDIILHPLFHIWVAINPETYEKLMHIFVAGLHLEVTDFDISFWHIAIGTVIEATTFWVLGYVVASIYNKLND